METLAASSLHFSLIRWPALRHSPLEHQQGTLSCGVQAPLHPLPPVPGRGQHPRHRQSLVSQHAQTSRSFRQLFGRPAVFKLKMEFPQRFCLLAVAAGGLGCPRGLTCRALTCRGGRAAKAPGSAPAGPGRGEAREEDPGKGGRSLPSRGRRLRAPLRDISRKGPTSCRGWRSRGRALGCPWIFPQFRGSAECPRLGSDRRRRTRFSSSAGVWD